MDLLKKLKEMVEDLRKLDPVSRKYQELEDEIEKCKDYLMEHGE